MAGWYWWRSVENHCGPSVHYVEIEEGEPHAYYPDEGEDLLEDYSYELAGPIPEPEEPS